MRALLALVIVMGVLIVVGVGVGGGVLDEPAGTHIAGVSAYGDRLAVTLQGGGADRIVLFDPVSGKTLGHVTLAH
jgi:hypothetical protein